jgi:hypothetical protein
MAFSPNAHTFGQRGNSLLRRIFRLENSAECELTLTPMDKAQILLAAQAELKAHAWTTFVDNPPSVAQGGNGVVVPGCPRCKKRLNTTDQFVRHLADDVLPTIVEQILTPAQSAAPRSDP